MKHLFQAVACYRRQWRSVDLFEISVLHFNEKKKQNPPTDVDLSVKRIIFVQITGTASFFCSLVMGYWARPVPGESWREARTNKQYRQMLNKLFLLLT